VSTRYSPPLRAVSPLPAAFAPNCFPSSLSAVFTHFDRSHELPVTSHFRLCFHRLTNCPFRLPVSALLCFQALTSCLAGNSRVFTTICVAGGLALPALGGFPVCSSTRHQPVRLLRGHKSRIFFRLRTVCHPASVSALYFQRFAALLRNTRAGMARNISTCLRFEAVRRSHYGFASLIGLAGSRHEPGHPEAFENVGPVFPEDIDSSAHADPDPESPEGSAGGPLFVREVTVRYAFRDQARQPSSALPRRCRSV
jgi:hypothetical protein